MSRSTIGGGRSTITGLMYRRVLRNCRSIDRTVASTMGSYSALRLAHLHLDEVESQGLLSADIATNIRQALAGPSEATSAQRVLLLGGGDFTTAALERLRSSGPTMSSPLALRQLADLVKLSNLWRNTLFPPPPPPPPVAHTVAKSPLLAKRHRTQAIEALATPRATPPKLAPAKPGVGGLPFRLGRQAVRIEQGMLAIRLPASASDAEKEGPCSGYAVLLTEGSAAKGWSGVDLTTPLNHRSTARRLFSAISNSPIPDTAVATVVARFALWNAGDVVSPCPWLLHSCAKLIKACPAAASRPVAAGLWCTLLCDVLKVADPSVAAELAAEAVVSAGLFPRAISATVEFKPSELETLSASGEWYVAPVLDIPTTKQDSSGLLHALRNVDPNEVWRTALRCIAPSPPSSSVRTTKAPGPSPKKRLPTAPSQGNLSSAAGGLHFHADPNADANADADVDIDAIASAANNVDVDLTATVPTLSLSKIMEAVASRQKKEREREPLMF